MLSCTTLNVYCNRFNVLCFFHPANRPKSSAKLQPIFQTAKFFLTFFFGLAFGLPDVLSPGHHPCRCSGLLPESECKVIPFSCSHQIFPTLFMFYNILFLTSFLRVGLKKLTSRQFHFTKNLVKSRFILFFLDADSNSHDFHC